MLVTLVALCPYCYSPSIVYDTNGVAILGIMPDGSPWEEVKYREEAWCSICKRYATPLVAIAGVDNTKKVVYAITKEGSSEFFVIQIPVVILPSGAVTFMSAVLPEKVAELDINEMTMSIHEKLYEVLIMPNCASDAAHDLFNVFLTMAGIPTQLEAADNGK